MKRGKICNSETAIGRTGMIAYAGNIPSMLTKRLRKMNISNYDISSTLATSISQRLVRKLCPKCRKEYQEALKILHIKFLNLKKTIC